MHSVATPFFIFGEESSIPTSDILIARNSVIEYWLVVVLRWEELQANGSENPCAAGTTFVCPAPTLLFGAV